MGSVRFAAALGVVIFGLEVAVAFFLLRGSKTARTVTTILIVIGLFLTLFESFDWTSLLTIVLSIVFLVCLYSHAANAFFEANSK